jgi:hypothetical protein
VYKNHSNGILYGEIADLVSAIAELVGWVEQSETQQQIDKAIMDLWNTVAQDLQEALTFLLL